MSNPSSTPLRLLAIGDVHLGTRPGSLPEDLVAAGLAIDEVTPAAALAIAIDRAIALDVHAVVFAGDVVESTNARFEARGPLELAVAKLHDRNIPAIAVVGNHDVEALPRLVDRIPGLEILGAGGQWQTRILEVDGKPAAELVGWSFPERRVSTSPVAELVGAPLVATSLPRIGLLHGDLDASGGIYAPFTSSELKDAGLDAWLLGHIHKPSFQLDSPIGVPSGYLGSLVGLSPKESGRRGPWLIEVDATGKLSAEHLAIAPLHWQHLDMAVGEADTVLDVADNLSKLAESSARQLTDSGTPSRLLGLRIRLTGRSRNRESIAEWCDEGGWAGATEWAGETAFFVNKVTESLELTLDLQELSIGDDPLALMAQKLLVLKEDGESRQALLAAARQSMQGVAENGSWSKLDELRDAEDPLADAALIETLTRAGTSALEALLAQRGQREQVTA
ncbi:MAG: exonuclease SbcD [Bacteroidia bacterium]|jgi:DNA repair exonuclease SbcCD nuclease subunit